MGLRLKFNLAIVPIVTRVIVFAAWADYRHESAAVMESHAIHAGPVGMTPIGPVAGATLPSTVARQSLGSHALSAAVLLMAMMIAINVALHAFVFRPLDRMRLRLKRIEHGHWREATESAGSDELGRFAAQFNVLGLEIGAVVGQAVHAERLTVVALLSRHLTERLEPEVNVIARVAAELNRRDQPETPAAGAQLTRSAASMISTIRGLDRVFPPDARHVRHKRTVPARLRVEAPHR